MEGTILVVEDDADILESVRDLLEQEGYAVLEARDGREALAVLARSVRPGLILLDLQMPVMDGFELLAELGRRADLATVPVVVLSAASTQASPAGLPFIRKPFSIEALLEAARRYLS